MTYFQRAPLASMAAALVDRKPTTVIIVGMTLFWKGDCDGQFGLRI